MKLIIQSAGHEDGNTAGLFLNDGNNAYQPSRGINYIRFDEGSLQVIQQQAYDTYGALEDAMALYEMLTGLGNASDQIICLAVMDSAETHLNTTIDDSSVAAYLTEIGSKYIGEVGHRDSWAMMFKKQDDAFQVLFEGYRPRNRGMVKGAPMASGYIRFREGVDSDENTATLDKGTLAKAQVGIRNHIGYIAENIDKGEFIGAPVQLLSPSWDTPQAFVAQQQTIAIDVGPNFEADQSRVNYQLYRDDVLIHTFEGLQPETYLDENRAENTVYHYHIRTARPKNGTFISRNWQKDIVPRPKLLRFNQFSGRVAWDDVTPPLGGEVRYDLTINELDVIRALGNAKEGFTAYITSNRFVDHSLVNHHRTHTQTSRRAQHHQVTTVRTHYWRWPWHRSRHTRKYDRTSYSYKIHRYIYKPQYHHGLTTHKTHNKQLEHLEVAPNDGHELKHHVTHVPGQGVLTQVTRVAAQNTIVTEGLGVRTIQDLPNRATQQFYNPQEKLIEQNLSSSFWDIPQYGLSNVAMQYKGFGTVMAKRRIDPNEGWIPSNMEYSVLGSFTN
ncbi:MAG: interleukin-like EMT inducer domain-containing protein [Bacteroidota bacterium]